jgi:sugar phosphate isomerase/epimerase
MYLTGFADEAAAGIDGQIRATKELGWQNIESRNIDGKNIHDLSDKEFDIVYGKLQDAGININCFGSAIANWSKGIDQPFDSSLGEARRAIPRMKKLGTKLIRIMSFTLLKDRGPEDQMEQERFHRLRELQKMFTDEGLMPVNENCMNYGGMGWTYALRMIENVPGLKIVFDTGNPVSSDDFSAKPPCPKQSAWEFYSHVKQHVAYIHVKDGVWDKVRNQMTHTFPGEGQGDVRKILRDMLARGYDDGISIEPHMAVVAHDQSVQSPEEIKHNNYVEYGRRLMKILAELKKK